MALDLSLRARGSRLIIRRGPARHTLADLLATTGADAVFWTSSDEPSLRRVQSVHLKDCFSACNVHSVRSSTLFPPDKIITRQGTPYVVFTPFWQACLREPEPPEPMPAPPRIPAPDRWPESLSLDALELTPRVDWAVGIRAAWHFGETAAQEQLERFLEARIAQYDQARDRPEPCATSRLSPYLHFGEISPRRVWHTVREWIAHSTCAAATACGHAFLRQLGWREFARYLLYHFPHTETGPLRNSFADLVWSSDTDCLRAWQRGQTGYPFIDAGMRELWTTGWMHNRVRMLVASFLVKDLLISWLEGARWFWDTLVDADLANNTLGWQWAAGCGADAVPYFRIFNPVTQGIKFDPAGAYVRRWVPELAGVPTTWIHRPWQAPRSQLDRAGVVLGKTYPAPIVEHALARERALSAYARARRQHRT